MFYKSGKFLCYEQFMSGHNFPIPFKEYNAVLKAVPSGPTQLVKCHFIFRRVTPNNLI